MDEILLAAVAVHEARQLEEALEEARQRIFIDTPLSFYSILDEWLYIEISDDRLCDTCNANARMEGGVYTGDLLRSFFPEHVILDVNTIKVNQHPNCRCVLVRVKPI